MLGTKANQILKQKVIYTDEPSKSIELTTDFLPAPTDLAYREEGVKVTLVLSKTSVDFFKSGAQKCQTQYQRVILRLLDSNVAAQSTMPPAAKRSVRKRAPV
jgi:hypothetical protein